MLARTLLAAVLPPARMLPWAFSMLAAAFDCAADAVIALVAWVMMSLAWSLDRSPLATLTPSCWMSCFWASEMLRRLGLSVHLIEPSSWTWPTCRAVVSGVTIWPVCGLGGGFQSGPFETSFELPCWSISRTLGERGSFCAIVYVVSVGSGEPSCCLASV